MVVGWLSGGLLLSVLPRDDKRLVSAFYEFTKWAIEQVPSSRVTAAERESTRRQGSGFCAQERVCVW